MRTCRNCEYWDDGGGEIPAKTATIGECLNRLYPPFTTAPTFTCERWRSNTPSLVGLTIPDRKGCR